MALVTSLTSVAASGTDANVLEKNLLCSGARRLWIKNTGSNALSACKIQVAPPTGDILIAPATGNYANLDTTTFASLASGAILQLLIPAPIDWIRILATCGSGTTLDLKIA